MKIGELGKQAHVKVDTIRYYEKRELLSEPKRTSTGYRSYAKSDVDRLRFIVQAKTLGFTLTEIKALLSLQLGKENCAQVRAFAQQKTLEIADKIAHLSRMKDVLDDLANQCAQGSDDVCPILKSLEGLD